MIETASIDSISSLLKYLKLESEQRHEHFHIISFKDDMSQITPVKISLRSENYFEVTLTKKGGSKLQIDGKKYDAEASQLTFLSPGQSIYVDNTNSHQNEEGYLIFFTKDFLNISPTNISLVQRFPYFNRNFSPLYNLNGSQSTFFFDLMDQMYNRFKSPSTDELEIIKSYLNIILFESKKIIENTSGHFHSRAEEITYEFENIMRQNSKIRLVRDFADALNITPIYLSECIKSTTGKTAKKIITDYKIWEAKSYLHNSNKTVDQIASVIGFDDRSNFINFFKKHMGMAPTKYRKLNPQYN